MSELGPLISLAFVLTAGLIGGELFSRVKLPRVTGWIATGILLRAFEFELLSPDRMGGFKPLSDFVLGYIAFTVGSHLHLSSLKNARKRLLLLMLTEATITPLIVVGAMCWLGDLSLAHGFLFAAIAVAGAPGTTVLIVREARATGVFVKTLVAAVALIDMVAVCLFVTIETELDRGLTIEGLGFVITSLPEVIETLGLAVGVGLGCALIAIVMTRAIVGPALLGASLVAAILLAWGSAEYLGVSSILAVTFLGVALANLIADKERAGEAYLGTFSSVLFTAFYTLAGLRLSFAQVLPVAGLVALFFLGRAVGKTLSAFTAMTLAGAPAKVRNYLGVALLPHGGVAIGLIIMVHNDPELAQLQDVVLAVGLSALAINQLVGPSATRFALTRAGEAGLDRPRLLDFIREQDIVTNLQAKTKADAIRKLVDVMVKTHDLRVEKLEFLTALVTRDEDQSTYLGEGLMIPHASIPKGDLVGVIGISSKGFDWETHDGHPVHAIVVLGTPTGKRDRHLEILAAFARAITSDRNIRDQLYHAKSPAHAYEILHTNDAAEDFNYFFEDTLAEDSAST